MDMKKYVTGNYLTVDEVKAAEVKAITVLSKGETKEGKFGEVVEFEVQLAGSDELKKFTPFSKSVATMIEQEGSDSIKWIGKIFELNITKTKNDVEVLEVVTKK